MADPGFTSGDGGRTRFARWLRLYRAPFAMSVAFVVVLAVFWVLPDPVPTEAQQVRTADTTEPRERPRRSPCVACGIGYTCEEGSGECVLTERTPIPCVKGSTYDEEQGFCVPDETPEPEETEPPVRTLRPGATPRSTSPPATEPPNREDPDDLSPTAEPSTPEPTATASAD